MDLLPTELRVLPAPAYSVKDATQWVGLAESLPNQG